MKIYAKQKIQKQTAIAVERVVLILAHAKQ